MHQISPCLHQNTHNPLKEGCLAGPETANIVQVNPGFEWHFQQSIGTHRLLINDRCISCMKHMYMLYKIICLCMYMPMGMGMGGVHVHVCFVCICILCVCECVCMYLPMCMAMCIHIIFCACTHAYQEINGYFRAILKLEI